MTQVSAFASCWLTHSVRGRKRSKKGNMGGFLYGMLMQMAQGNNAIRKANLGFLRGKRLHVSRMRSANVGQWSAVLCGVMVCAGDG